MQISWIRTVAPTAIRMMVLKTNILAISLWLIYLFTTEPYKSNSEKINRESCGLDLSRWRICLLGILIFYLYFLVRYYTWNSIALLEKAPLSFTIFHAFCWNQYRCKCVMFLCEWFKRIHRIDILLIRVNFDSYCIHILQVNLGFYVDALHEVGFSKYSVVH